MRETKGNMWHVAKDYDAIVVTTNGCVKKNGSLVMGKGLAKQFNDRYPELPSEFGELVGRLGNRPHWAYKHKGRPYLLSLPTQPHWQIKSTYEFVMDQCQQLMDLIDGLQDYHIKTVLTVRPGCGLGGLQWQKLKPKLSKIWDDRFMVIS